MKSIIILLMLPLTSFAHIEKSAKSTIKIQYGVAIDAEKILDTSIKSVNIGYYTGLAKSLSWTINGGYFGDNKDEVNTGYGCAQFGAAIQPFDWAFIENYFGPCYFSNLESSKKLSGKLQFSTNMGLGWRDPATGSEIGVHWRHFSNAGLSRPNLGVDLFMFSMAFGL